MALAFNIDGVDNLVLNGETAAKIFNGQITTWNDPAIAALNEGAALPDTPITVFFRSDSSGTTDNFQQYLQAASNGIWTQGAGSDFTGGVGQGAKGSAGVAQAVATTPGSITYVETSFADQNQLKSAATVAIHTDHRVVNQFGDASGDCIGGEAWIDQRASEDRPEKSRAAPAERVWRTRPASAGKPARREPWRLYQRMQNLRSHAALFGSISQG